MAVVAAVGAAAAVPGVVAQESLLAVVAVAPEAEPVLKEQAAEVLVAGFLAAPQGRCPHRPD